MEEAEVKNFNYIDVEFSFTQKNPVTKCIYYKLEGVKLENSFQNSNPANKCNLTAADSNCWLKIAS